MAVNGTTVATGSTAIHAAFKTGGGGTKINSARALLPAVVNATLLVYGRLLHRAAAKKANHRHGVKQPLKIWKYLLRASSLVRQRQHLQENAKLG